MKVSEIIEQYKDLYEQVRKIYPLFSTKELLALILAASIGSKNDKSLETFMILLDIVVCDYVTKDPFIYSVCQSFMNQMED